ncbi:MULTISPECIES: MFS transporter [unclassified Pseudomonas]|uniref:MFS transporter n=1 Tax=unclassified Pseudomonas TaxID=196821 RepID=UPI002600C0FB|nr:MULTISPECIES: MFS transporter [unclassified Pseudomonas]
MTSSRFADSLWAPFRFAAFRWLWMGALAMNLSIWMQSVGAAWVMVSLTPSPLPVALVQTAISLPSFIFGLPGGVFADIFDRRRYLLLTHAGMLVSAVLLVVWCACGWLGPISLLALTFAFGIGFAMQGPAWYTSQAEAVPVGLVTSAMALSSVSYSCARAVGPAIAGALVSFSGVITVFAICALLLAGSLAAAMTLRSKPKDALAPAVTLREGLITAIRYARSSSVIRAQTARTLAFVGAGSALWALLPLVASESAGAGGYGVLLGSIGVGTLFGALIITWLRARVGINGMLSGACLAYAVGTVVLALLSNTVAQSLALFVAGIGWMLIGTSNLAAIQLSVPAWIRARSVAIYMLVFQGSMAVGGALWGLVAIHVGARNSLLLAAAMTLLALWLMHCLAIKPVTQVQEGSLGSDNEVAEH